jgi:hypothetical protein
MIIDMCSLTKPDSAAGDTLHRQRGERSCDECRAAVNTYQRNRRAQGVIPGRKYQVWSWYRLRWDAYLGLLSSQGQACGVCGQAFGQGRAPHIDHDHSCDHADKGRKSCSTCVRGILCQRCNTGMAVLEDPDRLHRALAYLERAGGRR